MNKEVENVVRSILAQVSGADDYTALCALLCAKYSLNDVEMLKNVYAAITSFQMFHQDIVRDSHVDRHELNAIKRDVDHLRKALAALNAPHRRKTLGGSLVAVLAGHDLFLAFECMHAILGTAQIATVSPVEPAQATLEAFVLPLCEYWWNCTGDVPGAEFDAFTSGAPVPGTAAAFVVECLEAAGWSYSYDRVSDAMVEAIITINMWAADDQSNDADE